MKTRGILAVIVACLAIPATASAVTIQTSDTSQPWQAWANQSQAPTYAGTVPLTTAAADSACGEDAGCASIFPQVDQTTGAILPGPPASVSIAIAVGDPADMERGYLLHELGHIFDAEYMTSADRDRFMSILGLSGGDTRWWYTRTTATNGVTITFAPGEWFAESYRMCATWGINQPKVNTFEDYGYPGDRSAFAARQQQACQLIDHVGLDNGIPTPAQATYPVQTTTLKLRRPVKVARVRQSHHRLRITWGRRRVW